ncbi:hypothetical protein T492DRAFT_1103089 [Pavlovales sp. CCMP2436]|nr:hypothetical protein T492DRAFT_1103089 [Pavlovales sp. CCMP2436]
MVASETLPFEIEVAGPPKMPLHRAQSFDVRRLRKRPPPLTDESQPAAAPAAQPSPAPSALAGNKFVLRRTLSAPRQRRCDVGARASQFDGADASPRPISGGCIDAEGDGDHAPSDWLVQLMARARASDPTLRRLRLSAHIEMATLSRGAQSATILDLRANSTLTELSLDRLQLNDEAARAIATLLGPRGTPALLKLSCERNCITDAGALAMCAALAFNSRLTELSVADQLRSFTQAIVHAFCEMLEGRAAEGEGEVPAPNYSLRRLNLGRVLGPVQRLSKLVMRNTDRTREARLRAGTPSSRSSSPGAGHRLSAELPSGLAGACDLAASLPAPLRGRSFAPLLSARLQPAAFQIGTPGETGARHARPAWGRPPAPQP